MNSAIENLNQFGGQFLKFAWPMLWQSSLLILLVLMVDVLTARKIRASVRHALWLVVLAKLLLPPTLALPTGAAWWLFPAKPVVLPAVSLPVANNNYTVVVDDALLPADITPEPVPHIEPPKPKLTGAGWTLLASGVVSAGLLAWLMVRWGQLARKVRGAAKILVTASPENIAEAFERARQCARLRAGTRLKLVEGNMSPAVCGLFRPVILLPRLLVEKLSAAQLQAVLLHEMIHLRRKDIWVNCAQSLLQIFYWWHPLVWVANARIRRVREEAVDDAVMLALAEDAEHYAPTLLEVAKLAFRRPLLSLGLVGIMESRSALRQRIERLMDFRAPRKAGLTLVSVCGIFVFSAVAVPMGQGPARAPKELASNIQATDSSSTDTVLVGDTLTTVSGVRIARLNPDFSLDLYSTNANNALRLLGQRTGVEKLGEPEITTERLRTENRAGIFPAREVSTEDYRPDFVKENQIGNTPFPKTVIDAGPYSQTEMLAQLNQGAIQEHRTTQSSISTPPATEQNTTKPQVLITAQFCRMPAQNLKMLTSSLEFNRGYRSDDSWWSVSPGEFGLPRFGMQQMYGGIPFPIELEPGVKLLGRPQILTFAGEEAEMDISSTNGGLRFDCTPTLENGLVNLAIHAEMIDGAEKSPTTNQFRATAAAENFGGLVIRLGSTNDPDDDQLVGIIDVIVVTNTPAGSGGEAAILVQAGKSLNELHRQSEAESDFKTALAVDPKNADAKYYLDSTHAARLKNKLRNEAEAKKFEQEAREQNIITLNGIRIPHIRFDRMSLDKVEFKLAEAALKNDHLRNDGYVGFTFGDSLELAATNVLVSMPEMTNARLADILDAVVQGADKPIKYSINTPRIGVFSTKSAANEVSTNDSPGRYQQRLVRITKPAVTNGVEGNQTSSPTAAPADEPTVQLHIKARFISVPQNTMAGFENYWHGLNPGNGQFTGILTDTNMRALLRALRSQKGVETLGEPEITTLVNRRTQMRATDMVTVVTNMAYDDQGSLVPQTATYELGPIFDVTPHVLADGFTINLKAVPALTEFLGYRQLSTSGATTGAGQAGKLPGVAPVLQTQKLSVEANLRDDQTLVLGGLTSRAYHPKAGDVPQLFQADGKFVTNDVLVFITATIVDPAGSRVHAEGELAPGQSEIPEQPATTNSGGVEFSTPVPAQLPGHGAIPHGDPGGTDRLLLEGKELYERLKLKEAKAKFTEVIRLETNNATALYYLDAVKQMQTYFLPASSFSPDRGAVFLPVPNAYATNHLIFTGPGRQAIVKKLDTIHIDTVSYDSLPLNEVLKQLATQCRLHDPERKGINFLINNNPDLSAPPGSAVKVASSGPNLDPATGFLLTPAATEPPDVGSYIIKIPSLTDVRMADVLDAIELVSDHPLKYSIQDFAVVFSANSEPQLFMRTFRVNPNTFYSGLESVSALNNNAGAVVGVVNAFSGANGLRNNGGGGSQGGSGSVLKNQTDVGEANEDRNPQSLQGSSYVTAQHPASTPSALARTFFTSLGVNLVDPPGKSVFFNDRLGYLFVKATKSDLDTIEKALQAVNQTPPQLHIKARFIEVPKGMRDDLKATNPVFGKPIWILTDTNFRAILRDLASYSNVETLGEPEVTMLTGRQAQVRITEMVTVITNLLAETGSGFNPGDNDLVPQTSTSEVGPILDVVPYVLADGYTINLSAIPSLKEFLGYDQPDPQSTNTMPGQVQLPRVLPRFQTQQIVANVNLWDNQTLVLGGLEKQEGPKGKNVPVAGDVPLLGRLFQTMNRRTTNMDVLVFITVNIVDPAGRRVHSDDEMPFAKDGVPTQPAGK